MESNTPDQQSSIKGSAAFSQIIPAVADLQSINLPTSASESTTTVQLTNASEPTTVSEFTTTPQPAKTAQPSKPFKGCTFTVICLSLIIIGIISATISAYFSSAFVGAFILAIATLLSLIVPFILWLIDNASPDIQGWLNKRDYSIEKCWNKLTNLGRLRISQTVIRFCSIILVLCAIIVGGIIYPAVPQSIHDKLVCGICIDYKTGAGISDGQYHFWQENGPNNPQNLPDVETFIYNENQQITTSGLHHVTIAVVTTLAKSGEHIGVGYDDLQAAYILQNEANQANTCHFQDSVSCLYIRLLVVNIGDNMEYSSAIASQIVQVASSDPTFVGVIGWPLSRSEGIDGLRILSSHKILVISSIASSDALTAISPYFFRVAPVDSAQGPIAAQYAETTFPDAHNAAIFYTPDNPYSLTLATSFLQTFTENSRNHYFTEIYSTASNITNDQKTESIKNALRAACGNKQPADLIYFAGYSDDLNKLLNMLRGNASDCPSYSTLPIISGDSAYDLGGYTGFNYQNIFFTGFASPDEWGNFSDPCTIDTRLPSIVRAFFCDYVRDFDPHNQHSGTYGFSRMDSHVILTYDAATVLIQGYLHSSQPTQDGIRNTIQHFTICNPLQGVSGPIAFGPDNNVLNKPFVLLEVGSGSSNQTGYTIFHSVAPQGRQLMATGSQGC